MKEKSNPKSDIRDTKKTQDIVIPDWHIELVLNELENITNGKADV